MCDVGSENRCHNRELDGNEWTDNGMLDGRVKEYQSRAWNGKQVGRWWYGKRVGREQLMLTWDGKSGNIIQLGKGRDGKDGNEISRGFPVPAPSRPLFPMPTFTAKSHEINAVQPADEMMSTVCPCVCVKHRTAA
ncbi:unnamed protein product [Pylaiella littoralis]